jgi:hypothetical protein
MKKIYSLLIIFSLIVVVFANILAVYFLYLMFYPFKTLEVYDPVKVVGSKVVKRGDQMVFEISYEKYVDVDVDRTRYVLCNDGNLVTIAPDSVILPSGSHMFKINHFVIPAKISNSTCHMVWNSVYHVNPIRTIVVSFKSEDFTVVPN